MTKHTQENSNTTIKNCSMQNLIKTLRTSNHLTQKELAQKLGISQQEISKLEKPNARITLNILADICIHLDFTPVITFSSTEIITLLDVELIDNFNALLNLPLEKQHLIFTLIKDLS